MARVVDFKRFNKVNPVQDRLAKLDANVYFNKVSTGKTIMQDSEGKF